MTSDAGAVALDANKALIRHVFEKVIPAGDRAAMRDLVAPDWVDHDPLPGQPGGLDGAEYVVSTMHGAHPDLRFTIDDLVAEADRVTIRWTLRGTNTGPMLGRPPTGEPVELAAIVIFRIADGKIAERWAGWKPGRAPVRLPATTSMEHQCRDSDIGATSMSLTTQPGHGGLMTGVPQASPARPGLAGCRWHGGATLGRSAGGGLGMTGPDERAAAGGGRLRAGHADRERVIQALKDAFVQDRLTRDELDARTGLALTARTVAELAALTGDIPAAAADLAAAGLARPPVAGQPADAGQSADAGQPADAGRPGLVERHPLIWGFTGAGSCLAIAFGFVILASDVLDPRGLGNPHHPWSMLCGMVSFVALLTGIGILIHGLGTAEEQRRARKQLSPGGQGGA